jgi:hypothetical protein
MGRKVGLPQFDKCQNVVDEPSVRRIETGGLLLLLLLTYLLLQLLLLQLLNLLLQLLLLPWRRRRIGSRRPSSRQMRSFRGDGGGAGRKLVLARRSQGSAGGGCRVPTAAAGTLLRRAVEAAPPSVTSIEEAVAVGLEVVALRAEVVVVVRGGVSVEEAAVRLRVHVEGVGRRDIFRTTCIVRIFLFIFFIIYLARVLCLSYSCHIPVIFLSVVVAER